MPPALRRWIGSVLVTLMVFTGVGVAFPQDPLDVDIELYYDSTWNNINSYVYHRGAAPITITRGRANEGKRCDPGRLNLELNNRDGRFSPRNPSSPLFGKIGRNTQIRIKVTHDAVTYTRFVGEVVAWPSRWEVSGKDVWVPLEAAGILRRLGQGSKPLRSPLYRAMAGLAPGDYRPHAYWPMEDGSTATQFASALAAGSPVRPAGSVVFAADAGLAGSDALPLFDTGGSVTFPIPAYTDTGQWMTQFVMMIPADPTGIRTYARISTTGAARTIDVVLDTVTFAPTTFLYAKSYDSTGALISEVSASLPTDFYGNWSIYTVAWTNDFLSPFTDNLVWFDVTSVASPNVTFNGGYVGSSDGVATSITLLAASDGVGFGHVGFYKEPTSGDPSETSGDLQVAARNNADALSGHAGETADERFARICEQHEIPYEAVGSSDAQMGPERIVAKLEVLRNAEDADQGFLCERRDELGLKFRTNSSKYNQVPIQLDYGEGHISPPFDPEPDDQNVANDREVKRRNGSSARRELTSGPLSVQDPPDGIGRYDDSITLDAYSDEQLGHIAQWRVHVGTWDSERYPRVRVDLSANQGQNAALIPQIAAADSGDLMTVANLPAWLPPEDAELIIEGYRERIGFYDWDFIFNCSPAGPYQVVGGWGLMSHELHSAVNTSATSIEIANTDVTQPMLSTTVPLPGYGTKINGEEMQLTAVTASTITFGATGTASTGASGSRTPGLPTSSASGNLILVFASTRNSGTGVPDTPANWTRLPIFPATACAQVFGRIYDGVWSMPTVTYTGGAANEDTIAQSARLPGKWHDPANIVIGAAHCLNASAQNVTYPGLAKPAADNSIILYFAWKQDDYTSVTSPGTEIQEASSTAGNDASQVWAYQIQTTAFAIESDVFTVTGGAAGISRGAVAALRCDYQTATVTRSTNGVTASHAAGDDVTLTRPMRWALL